MTTRRELLRGVLCLGASSLTWGLAAPRYFALPSEALFGEGRLPTWVHQLAERHLRIWETGDDAELSLERSTNAEWDFMGRTFLVLALANLCLRRPAEQARYLSVMDRAIADTLEVEAMQGFTAYLMPYGRRGGWVYDPASSLFVDGEVAAMLAARLLVAKEARWEEALSTRLARVSAQMRAGPMLSGESYPNECWTFCNTLALAALRMGERLGLSPDRALPADWLRTARQHLVHRPTGILLSSFQLDGVPMDGPEGSSIWLASHMLQLVDEDFARQQFELARDQLSRSVVGFGYAKEWPDIARGPQDIDSGPEVPLLRVSPGSSGLAFVGAHAFGDRGMFEALTATLEMAAFPERRRGQLRYLASNQVGDAVLLYAAVLGPLWSLVQGRRP